MSVTVADLYIRVSTDKQVNEGYSLEEQKELLIKYAQSKQWIINNVYVDGGFSGKSIERPGIQGVITDAKERKINKVCTYKLDRLSRSQKETLYLIEDVFLKNHVDYESMTESLDTSTPIGMAMIGILSAFAQLERSQIVERMNLGRDARIKEGNYRGGAKNIPIGYRWDKANQKLLIDDYEASIVRNIYKWYLDGETMNGIARVLNLNYRFRNRETWAASNIRRILSNPLYIGLQRWKGENIRVNADGFILDDITFSRVQAELERRNAGVADEHNKRQTAYKHQHLLGGMVFCGKCGKRYSGVTDHAASGNVFKRYYCQMRLSAGRQRGQKCLNKGYKAEELHGIVLGEIRKLSADRSLVAKIIAPEDSSAELAGISKRLKEIDKQYERLIDLYTLGSIDADAIQRRSEVIQAEKKKLIEQQNKIKSTKQRKKSLTEANAMFDTFDSLIDNVEDEIELYPIVHQLIKSITIDDDNVVIDWNLD